MKTTAVVAILLLGFLLGGCSSVPRDSSEAAWRRGQCEQIVDEKLRQKCLDQVDAEFGRW